MGILSRLRRNVALLLCPELSGAACTGPAFATVRGKGASPLVSGEAVGLEQAVAWVSQSADRFLAVVHHLDDCRTKNLLAGGDDATFLLVVAAQIAMINLPVSGGQR